MTYQASYDEGDIATSMISTIVKVLVTVGTLVTLIVVVYMFVWLKKKFK